jgi:hypothetical protein
VEISSGNLPDKIVAGRRDPDPRWEIAWETTNSRRSDWPGYGKVTSWKAVQAAVRKRHAINIGGARSVYTRHYWAEKFISLGC